MGATLPAVSRWVKTTPEGVSWLGFFYGGNIAGAVFGCLLAGFYLLREHDMAFGTYVAAGINATVATLALILAAVISFQTGGRRQPDSVRRRPGKEAKAAPPVHTGHLGARCGLFAIALSGLAALGAEVVWTRLLALMFGATVYTFSIILAVFLVGLGIGQQPGIGDCAFDGAAAAGLRRLSTAAGRGGGVVGLGDYRLRCRIGRSTRSWPAAVRGIFFNWT